MYIFHLPSCRDILSKLFLLILILFFSASPLTAQFQTSKKEIAILPVPSIGYSPETKLYVGAVTLFTFRQKCDSLTRSSNTKIEFNYSWNKQLILESDWNWFSSHEQWFSSGLIHYSVYPDKYYGIGFQTPDSNETYFESNRFIVDINLYRSIKNNRFVGGGIEFKSYTDINFVGENTTYSESDSRSFGVSATYLIDSRNNILSPSKGRYFKFNNSLNISENYYLNTQLDYRVYFSWGIKDSQVLAGRLYHESVFNEPPFYDFPMLGGDEYLRGYYLGRYRDNHLTFVQLEYRTHVFRRFGFAVFGGSAIIYDEINNIENQSLKPNAGVGLRFLIDKNEHTNLRIDYAIGIERQSGLYISFGESF